MTENSRFTGPSGSPLNLAGSSNSPFSIQLSWNPPLQDEQNGDITEHTINVTNVETLVTEQYSSNTTTITITDLQPFRVYKCIVAAVNSVSTGPFSLPVIIRTQESGKNTNSLNDSLTRNNFLFSIAPGASPDYVSGVTLNSTAILVTWDPPPSAQQNGVIDVYRISIMETNTGERFQLTTNQTQITISNLHPFYSYLCSVTAVTVEEGPYTDNVNVTTDEAGSSNVTF